MMATENVKLTISQFAERMNVKPSYITQLINDKRIPEAVRDPEDSRYRIPNRRCVIPARNRRTKAKINDWYFRLDEVPREWIDDPSTRPGTLDENGKFVGKELEGDEDESLAFKIARTFHVEVGQHEQVGRGAEHGTNRDDSKLPNASVERLRQIGIDLEALSDSGFVVGVTIWLGQNDGAVHP